MIQETNGTPRTPVSVRPQPSTVGPPSLLLPHARGGLRPRGLALAGSPARRFAAARAARAARRASRPAGPQGIVFSHRSRCQNHPGKSSKSGSQKNSISQDKSRENVPARVGYQRRSRACYKNILRGQYRASRPGECTHGRPPGGRPCCVPGIGGHRAPARACLRSDRPFVGRSPTAPRP